GHRDPDLARLLAPHHRPAIAPDVDAAEILDVVVRAHVDRDCSSRREQQRFEREHRGERLRDHSRAPAVRPAGSGSAADARVSAIATAPAANTSDAGMATRVRPAIGNCAPTRRLPMANSATTTVARVAGTRSSTSAASGTTR